MRALIYAAAALALAGPVLADGDAAVGEKEFRKCKACHMIVADDGTEIVKGGKTGPNLWGVIGRPVASADFKYGDAILAVGATGLVWDTDLIVPYLADPKGWLVEKTGDAGANSKMTFKLSKKGEDVAAYLASVGPALEAGADDAAEDDGESDDESEGESTGG